MNYTLFILFASILVVGCGLNSQKESNETYLTEQMYGEVPHQFMPDLIPDSLIVHRGIFSNDLRNYYFTVSDRGFSRFNVKVIKRINGKWSEPEYAFFNSSYNEHGMSFSPDGNTLFFSSTRPVTIDGIADTWHLWKSKKHGNKWTTPEFIDIPNLREKLLSHPTITSDGTLYFHSSNPDYSSMDIYFSNQVNGQFQEAVKVNLALAQKTGICTPYVSPDGTFLLFASIGESLTLNLCYLQVDNKWSHPQPLPAVINKNGQGNPYLTPDGKFLFYTTKNEFGEWSINQVSTDTFLKN